MTTEYENVRIKKAVIEIEDHGILTFGLHIEGSGWGTMFGGIALDQGRPRSYVSMRWLRELLETFEVRRWSDLEGQYARIEKRMAGDHCPRRIGHVIKDRWFDADEIFKNEREDPS